jgi:hypothetical protein
LHDGVLDYDYVLDLIRALPNQPTITLEMDNVEDMKASLSYLHLSHPTEHLRRHAYTTPSPDL